MKVQACEQIESRPVTMPGAEGCRVRWLVDERDGAPHFAMRHFEVASGGFTPKHSHPYEHEVYVLAGEGVVLDGDTQRPIRAGDVVYVAPHEVHQFRNTGNKPLQFLCLIPHSARNLPVTPAECSASATTGPCS